MSLNSSLKSNKLTLFKSFDKRVLSGISRFEPVSAGYLARVINVPNRPSVVQKNKSFDRKYVLTNELINNSKQEKEEDIEASMKRLIEQKKIIQSVPGYPKRYSVCINNVKKSNSPKNKEFDDDRFETEPEEYSDDPAILEPLTSGFKLSETEIRQNKLNVLKPLVGTV